MRTIVNVVPTAVLVLVVVGAVLGLVLLAVWAVRRFVPATREGFDAEVSSQVLGVAASLFGLLLAFVVVIEFQAFSAAGDNVAAEADGLAAIARDSKVFGEPDGTRVRAAISTYVRTVVDEEWPLMREGEESLAAWQAMDGIFAAMQSYVPFSASQAAFYDDSVRQLNAVLEARRDRLGASDGNDLPGLIAALVIVGSIAVIVGFSLVVLLTLQFPFSGGLAVDSRPFEEGALAHLVGPSK